MPCAAAVRSKSRASLSSHRAASSVVTEFSIQATRAATTLATAAFPSSVVPRRCTAATSNSGQSL
jgi:hypothetical protein